jgi:hypothetical protein
MNYIQTISIISALVSTSALADNTPPPFPIASSGLVSVAPQQFANINVLNFGVVGKDICTTTISFIDDKGAVILTKDFTLDGGQAISLQAPVASSVFELLRVQLDFTSQLAAQTTPANPLQACSHLIPTLEVADQTGTKVIDSRFFGLPTPNGENKSTTVPPTISNISNPTSNNTTQIPAKPPKKLKKK